MTLASELLPDSSGAFERAALHAMIDTLDVPITQMLDPFRTKAEFLPFLAHGNSVDLWFDDWLEERKRRIIAEWPDIASKIGTIAALRKILPFVDAELLDYRAPPQRFVLGSGPSDAAIAAWKARLPQLRIYNRSRPAPKRGEVIRRFVIGRSAFVSDVAWAYSGPEGVLYDPRTNIETSLRSVDIRQTERTSTRTEQRRAVIPGKASKRAFVVGRAVIGRAVFGSLTAARAITWSETETGVSKTAEALVEVTGVSGKPIDPRFVEIPVPINRRGETAIGRFVVGRSALVKNRAELSYYRRLHLSDPSLALPGERSHGRAVIGRTPFSQQAFNVHLLVRLKQSGRRHGFVVGRTAIGRAAFRSFDRDAMDRALTALRIVKAPEERHMADFAHKRRVRFGDGIPFDGSVTFGTFVDRHHI